MNRTKVVNALNKIKSGHVNEGVAEIESLLEVPEDFDKIVSAANQKYGTDDVEIDDDPSASDTENGCWVSAWVFVEREQDEEENQVTDQSCPRCNWRAS